MSILSTLKYYRFFKNHLYFYPLYAKELLYRSVFKRRRLLFAEFFFETRCNFRCWHCSSTEYTEKRRAKTMDLDQIRHVLKELKSMGALNVSFVGGEPTVNQDLEEIISITNSMRILPSVVTNGSLLTPERIDALFKAGLANLGFSVQSSDSAAHDELVRKEGAWARIHEHIEYCLKRSYPISICVVPTNENLANGDFDKLVAFATERSIRLNVNLPAPIGRAFDMPGFLLDKAQVDLLVERYFKLDNFLPDFKNSTVSGSIRCPMAERSVYILPDGEVCPCTFTQISFGNVLQEPLRTIVARMDASPGLKSLKRQGQCPISMDREFIAKVHTEIENSQEYPPRGHITGF